jgi:LysR family hydrogen peroxide-inducible transcriptional activator
MLLGGLSIRNLECLAAVAEHGTISAAAEACAIAQPSLSAQIKKVEDELGLAIFERSKRGMRVTDAGRFVLEQVHALLAEARQLQDVAAAAQDPLAGALKIGAIATLGPYLVPHLLAPLRGAFPRLRLVLNEGLTDGLVRDLVEGRADVALLSMPVHDKHIVVHPIFFEPFVAIVPNASPYAGRKSLRLADLDDERMLLMNEGHCLRDQALSLCKSRPGLSERHAASIETLRQMVAAGAGHSVVPALAVRHDPLIDDLVAYKPIDDPSAGRIIALAWRARDPRAGRFRALTEFLASLSLPGIRTASDFSPRTPPRAGRARRGTQRRARRPSAGRRARRA